MARPKRTRHRSDDKHAAIPISVGQPQTTVKSTLPTTPMAAVLSFLKETRGALTWNTHDMVQSLKVGEADANQIIAILSMQGYVKPALDNEGWLTTTAGEEVSRSRLPRFKLDSVKESLSLLEDRIKSINQDRQARLHVSEAVAYGDFLIGRPIVQAADVGVQLVAAKGEPDSKPSRETPGFLKLLRGKSSLIQLHPYQPWMADRSHRRLA
jgi:hypothetical protein